jgi:hypothetical protein
MSMEMTLGLWKLIYRLRRIEANNPKISYMIIQTPHKYSSVDCFLEGNLLINI